jgi:hypothetical protein
MTYLVLINVIMSAAVAGAIVAGGAWAIFATPAIVRASSASNRGDIESYRQVNVESRLAHGVA